MQTALVTGASSGVGRAVALALAEPEIALLLAGRDCERLSTVAREAERRGSHVRMHCADLAEEGAERRLAAEIDRAAGLDVLVHAMGIIRLGLFESASVAEFDEQYRANVRAPFAITQALLPALRARRGQVVFLNSTAGVVAGPGISQYAATKHALRALADSLREEVNADGIRVLSVFLGRTATPMQEAVHAAEGRPYDPSRLVQPEDVATAIRQALELPRTAEITELRIRPERKPR